jgi:ATP-dependent Clp protease adaptor protein ClpS
MSTEVLEKIELEFKEPEKFKCLIYNDDKTSMDFVVYVLNKIFGMAYEDSIILMLKVHNDGKAVCGVFIKEIAVSKVNEATTLARRSNYPLKITCEKA